MMKTSLIPALVSLMITLGMMDTAYATSQTGLHAPLSVREAPDLLNKLTVGAYELTVTSNQDYTVKLLVAAQKTLRNFSIIAIEYVPNNDTNDTTIRFKKTKMLYTLPLFSPDKPLYALVEMIGSIPNIGFSYAAEDGTTPVFSLNYNGNDGSLHLYPVNIVNEEME